VNVYVYGGDDFDELPLLTYSARIRRWYLEREVVANSGGYALVIPAGFVCDLSSVPRWLWFLAAPFELSIQGPLVHDWLYEHGGRITCRRPDGLEMLAVFDRKQADEFFYDLMRQEGVWWWRRAFAYRLVRWFGGRAWTR
jgi:hypothetical protein